MRLFIGDYCLAELSESTEYEREGYHYCDMWNGYRQWAGWTLEDAKRLLLLGLPEECRAYVAWVN